MLPDRVSNPGPLTYESGALPIALRGPARGVQLIRMIVGQGPAVLVVGVGDRKVFRIFFLVYHFS